LKYFLSFRIFEKLWLALKTEFALNFSSRGGGIFQAGGGRHPASYATEYTGSQCKNKNTIEIDLSNISFYV